MLSDRNRTAPSPYKKLTPLGWRDLNPSSKLQLQGLSQLSAAPGSQVLRFIGITVQARPCELLLRAQPACTWTEQSRSTSPKKIVFDSPSLYSAKRVLKG